ncbi:MAG: adenine phosphoribosyltransferase [Solirubrobacteraceae bacterium]
MRGDRDTSGARDGSDLDLRGFVREVPDFPRPGILFRDITPLLLDAGALDAAVAALGEQAAPLGVQFVVAAEARGFILGGALACRLRAGFVPARKPGKLPHTTISAQYALEYGLDSLEVHADALAGGARVLVHDDLLATGGTARALCDLVMGLGGDVVGCTFLVELNGLGGRGRLAPHHVYSLIEYDGA